MTRTIVVGFDGSEPSLDAVNWAGREAALREATLHIVHAVARWTPDVLLVPEPSGWDVEAEAAARRQLEEAALRARAGRPHLPVTTDLAAGSAAEALIAAAEGADLLVVGSRGRGGFTALLLGSVSRHVATRAPCPVAVVPQPRGAGAGTAAGAGTVVVGVSGQPGQDDLLDFAFAEAALRHATLRAVHGWLHPSAIAPGDMQPLVYDIETVGEQEALLLGQILAGWREKYPDVRLTQHVAHGHPAEILIRASEDADLLILGTHARPGPLPALGGTVHAVLHHARSPIIVVRT
ncbi:universal stress protein [Nonomuraea pusilla]|uniref:universal stress protein n=1 Tax=Nonomuraea pusilla TaxID=46177 RepID=UPI003323FEF3